MFQGIEKDFELFMQKIYTRCLEASIILDKYVVDHACYRVASLVDYRKYTDIFGTLSLQDIYHQHGNRMFHVYVLKKPLVYKQLSISLIELAEPGGNEIYLTGFQHIEILTGQSYDDFIKQDTSGRLSELIISRDNIFHKKYFQRPDLLSLRIRPRSLLLDALYEREGL